MSLSDFYLWIATPLSGVIEPNLFSLSYFFKYRKTTIHLHWLFSYLGYLSKYVGSLAHSYLKRFFFFFYIGQRHFLTHILLLPITATIHFSLSLCQALCQAFNTSTLTFETTWQKRLYPQMFELLFQPNIPGHDLSPWQASSLQ